MADLPSDAFEQLPLRSAPEVARRCLILYAVVAAGHKSPREELVRWLLREALWESVSTEESAFLRSSSPSRQQMIGATWRAEALLTLLWALARIQALPPPTGQCDVPLIRSALPPLLGSTSEFISKASIRNEAEIIDVHEDTYQAHWAVRDAVINDRPVPDRYNLEILQERHHALNWLIFPEQGWDDVTTDT